MVESIIEGPCLGLSKFSENAPKPREGKAFLTSKIFLCFHCVSRKGCIYQLQILASSHLVSHSLSSSVGAVLRSLFWLTAEIAHRL